MNMNGNTWKFSEAVINFQYMSLRSMFLSSVYGRYVNVILQVQEVLTSPSDGTRTIFSFPHFVRKVSQGKLIQSKPSSQSLGGLGGRKFSECTFLCNYFLIGTENSWCSSPEASYLHFEACPQCAIDHTSNVGMDHSMAIRQEHNNLQEEANGLLYLRFCCNFLQIRSGSLGAQLCSLTTDIFFQAMQNLSFLRNYTWRVTVEIVHNFTTDDHVESQF